MDNKGSQSAFVEKWFPILCYMEQHEIVLNSLNSSELFTL